MEVAHQVSGTQIAKMQREDTPHMTVGDWVITFFLMVIPVVNFILLFIWAFDSTSKRRNFSIAYLIMAAVLLGLSIFLVIGLFLLGAAQGFIELF